MLSAIKALWLTLLPSIIHAQQQQQQQQIITECNDEGKSNCATTSNRTCYQYEDDTTECGPCLLDFVAYEEVCYAIADIGVDGFFLLSKAIEVFLPEYADPNVTTAQRAIRLIASARVISYWNSRIPPAEFELELNEESLLTLDERQGRLGIDPSITFDNTDSTRGEMETFQYDYVSSTTGVVDEEGNNRKMRGLIKSTNNERVLQDWDVPPSIDWAEDGYTTKVKNQGICGCCWAVSVAAAVESALMITNQTSRYDSLDENSLSFQQMISCDNKEKGCQGGNILQATKYVWEHDDFRNGNFGGLVSYEDWPYSDFLGTTTTECQVPEGVRPSAYLNYPQIVNSVNDRKRSFEERRDRVKAAVAKQPVTSVIRSSCDLLMNYKDGILTHDSECSCCETSCIDHAIVIVGYDSSAPTPFWKIRNSWGQGWGEEGHFRIAMNDPGCGWGLFGLMAEQAMPSQAYKTLEELPERPGWWETAANWEKALVILFSILGFCCLCGCLSALWKRHKND